MAKNKIPKVKVKQVRKPMDKKNDSVPLDKNNQMDKAMRKAFKEKDNAET